jgi:DNA-binding response OmpR family regulator
VWDLSRVGASIWFALTRSGYRADAREMDARDIGELLVEAGAVPRAQLLELERGVDRARLLDVLMVDHEDAVAAVLAERAQTPALVFATSHLDLSALKAVPADLVGRLQVLPISLEAGVLTVAAATPDVTRLGELGVAAGARVTAVVAVPPLLVFALSRALGIVAAGGNRMRGVRCHDDDICVALARPPQPVTLPRADSVALALQAVFDGNGAPLSALQATSSTLAALRLKRVAAPAPVPLPEATLPNLVSVPLSSSEQAPARPQVLVVEDDAAISHLIAATLIADGCDVIEVASGERVATELRRRRPDLIVLDAMLPGIRGFEICAALKHSPTWASLPIVMVSAVYRGLDQAREIQEVHRADAFLEKPFKIEQLRCVVADVLARPKPELKRGGQRLSQAHAQALVAYHLKLGDTATASVVLGHWLADDPLSGHAWLERGHLFVHSGDTVGALQAYEQASLYEPDLFVAHLSLAMLYEQLGFARRARATWEKAASHAPDAPTADRIRGALAALDPLPA